MRRIFLLVLLVSLSVVMTGGMTDRSVGADEPTYTLRYQFKQGETIRWNVVHRGNIRTTVSGTSQSSETVSQSIKAWQVKKVYEDGTANFIHSVESVDMQQSLTGREDIRYNSKTDDKPPVGFEAVAGSVGVPLSDITLNPRGKVVGRKQLTEAKAAVGSDGGQLTILLPEAPVAVGRSWTLPVPIIVPMPNGTIQNIQAAQKFTLTSVKTGVATITLETQVLTPLNDPTIEVQLVQRLLSGTIRFDIDSGRILSQESAVDRRVVGFQGKASSFHCQTEFNERLIEADAKAETAKKVEPESVSR